MKVVEINTPEKFNSFLSKQKHSQLLQSFSWGEFQEKVGGKVFRLGVEEEGELAAAATIIKKLLPVGKNYFYCPRGPVGKKLQDSKQAIELLFLEIKELARKEKAMFLRFEPETEYKLENWQIEKTLDVQPSKTMIINLEKKEDELLESMHQKTRYNIRLAAKKGVEISEGGIEDFDKFWQLMSETSNRDDFRLHGIDYYKEMIKTDKNSMRLFFAKYKNKTISAGIFGFFGDTVTYMHGASSNEERNLMAPYLLQWEVMKIGKSQGYKYYDFYGINEEKWPGVTRFKQGFSGQEVNYPGTFDLVFDAGWYSVYKMIRKVRRTF
ncbi:MAG: peptidoglycan bridge formation glycyltransferase FemA/FemB family protein [Patescibacteria group bacterium]